MNTCKNRREDGGDTWVIDGKLVVNGKLELGENSDVDGLPVAENVAGIATPASSTAEANATKINAILTALKSAGLMEADSTD